MTTILALAMLLAAPAFAGTAGSAPGAQAAIAQAEAEAIALAITKPAVYVARFGSAAAMARVKLARQLRERFPRREAPERSLVRVCLRLTLRVNNTWLETISGRRIYPGQEDFDRFADSALAELKKYAGRLGKEHIWGPVDDKAAGDILDRELRRGINRLPVYRGRGWPPEPPPSAEENACLGR